MSRSRSCQICVADARALLIVKVFPYCSIYNSYRGLLPSLALAPFIIKEHARTCRIARLLRQRAWSESCRTIFLNGVDVPLNMSRLKLGHSEKPIYAYRNLCLQGCCCYSNNRDFGRSPECRISKAEMSHFDASRRT
jgi:hypothetical protein